jgi:hypothetical protein
MTRCDSEDLPNVSIYVYKCLKSHSITIQLYRGGQLYWRKKLEYSDKTTDLPQVHVTETVKVVLGTHYH